MLTKRQKQVLDYIKRYSGKHGYAPSLEEIGAKLGVASVSTVHFHIKKLEEQGYIKKEDNLPRAIEVNKDPDMISLPVLGTIAAGQPIEAIEIREEVVAIPMSRVRNINELYALKVRGDSMIDENINDGDIVIIKRQSTANNGDKIVALINNAEATLKKFYKEKNRIRLQPANSKIQPLFYSPHELTIQGKVVDVVKTSLPHSTEKVIDNYSEINIPQNKDYKFSEVPLDKIICSDTIDYMRQLPDQSIDLVIADPPYNLSKGNNINFSRGDLKGFGGNWNKVMESWDNLPFAEYFTFTYQWLFEIKRILKPTGSVWVFGTYHNIGVINTIFQLLEIEIINEVVWYKRNAFPNLAGRRLTASHETLLWGHAGKQRQYYFDYKKSKEFSDPSDLMKAAGKQMRTVWDIPNNKESRELKYGKHPTQKPLSICKRIIQLSSKPGAVVLAPFAGAGTECLAAKELGRHYLGIELEEEYVKIANIRLKASEINPVLF